MRCVLLVSVLAACSTQQAHGDGVRKLVDDAGQQVGAIAVDATHVYWLNDGYQLRLSRVAKEGGPIEVLARVDASTDRLFSEAQSQILMLDGEDIYFGARAGLMRVRKTGGEEPQLVVPGKKLFFAAMDRDAFYVNFELQLSRVARVGKTDPDVLFDEDAGAVEVDQGDVWIVIGDSYSRFTAAQLANHDLAVHPVDNKDAVHSRGEAWWSAKQGLWMRPRGADKDKGKLVLPATGKTEISPVAFDATHVYAVENDGARHYRLLQVPRAGGPARPVIGGEQAANAAIDGDAAWVVTVRDIDDNHMQWAIVRAGLPR